MQPKVVNIDGFHCTFSDHECFKSNIYFSDETINCSLKNKNIPKKLKLILPNTIIDRMFTYASETSILTKRDRKQFNIFERRVYRRILGPVYDNKKNKIGGY
jgi:hypothetical protein